MLEKELEYPVGSFIIWCDEYYKVCTNTNDYAGIVKDMCGDKVRFYFNFGGEKAKKITDSNLIKELENILDEKDKTLKKC